MIQRLVPLDRRELRLPGVDAREVYRWEGALANPMRGGVAERWLQLWGKRSEGEVKITRAVALQFRLRSGGRERKPLKARPATAEGHEGSGERQRNRYFFVSWSSALSSR
jgi:hypothetical protein